MWGNIELINPGTLEDILEVFEKDRIVQLSNKDFWLSEKKTRPLKGFKFPEKFPYCCRTHKKMLGFALAHFLKFPDCCEEHQALKKAPWFNKSEFAYFPIKAMLTYVYTSHCIDTCIDKLDWFKRITDYIEYTKSSFGQFPEGYGSPFGAGMYIGNVKHYITHSKNIPAEKRRQLLKWFEEQENSIGCVEEFNLPLLVKKYKEWLTIFPFDLSMFKSLKSYFTSRIPILKKPFTTNMYTGLTGSKILSYKELMDFLVSTTKKILNQINSVVLYKNNNLSDPDKTLLEVAVANREVSLLKYDTQLNDDTLAYRNVVTN